ncbi:MAG: carboxy-S-adenosyl-L-methionine synthase CmoA [Fuerstiella sp.]|nr:carboxy-S-adenosyl-L-methionine synthase CmoA [Fuerstiella sp.]
MNQDRIYSKPLAQVGQFEFDDSVANVFPDMIARSVPGYSSMLAMIEQITLRHATPNSQLYDLGCSLGAATERMRLHAPTSCTLHAIDNSQAMITRLRDRLKETSRTACKIITHENDIRSVSVENASVVVLNLTLQFVPCSERLPLLQSIHDGMQPGGVLLVSEKVCFDDVKEQKLMTDLHLDFKRAHGYSELEIAQKRTALEESLVTETLTVHIDRIQACGFCQVSVWFRCFNFASMIAIR